jgi:hypothetical protein
MSTPPYEIVWSGKGTIPGMSGKGWEQRRNMLLDEAPGSAGWITVEESNRMNAPKGDKWSTHVRPRGKPRLNVERSHSCACGRWKHETKATCKGCELGIPRRKVGQREKATHCSTCRGPLKAHEQRRWLRNCGTCRQQHRKAA